MTHDETIAYVLAAVRKSRGKWKLRKGQYLRSRRWLVPTCPVRYALGQRGTRISLLEIGAAGFNRKAVDDIVTAADTFAHPSLRSLLLNAAGIERGR